MDTNGPPLDSVPSLTEFKESEEMTTPHAKTESPSIDGEKQSDNPIQQSGIDECFDSNPVQIEVIDLEENILPLEKRNQLDVTSDNIDANNISIDSSEDFDSANIFNKSLNCATISDDVSKKNVAVEISSSENEIPVNDDFIVNTIACGHEGPNLDQLSGNINGQEDLSGRNQGSIGIGKLIESSDNVEDNLVNAGHETADNFGDIIESEESIMEFTTEENDINLNESHDVDIPDVKIQQRTGGISPEILLEGMQIGQGHLDEEETDSKSLQEMASDEAREALHSTDLEKVDIIIDNEYTNITQESDMECSQTSVIPDEIVYDKDDGENEVSNNSILNLTSNESISEGEKVRETEENDDNIEQQMSNIVHQEEPSILKTEETISIAEAISRDFDETDTEDTEKSDKTEQVKNVEVSHDNVMVGVTINDQLQHGTVTVTDTSGQVYYVQSVEDLIVVEDAMPTTLHQPETFEVTVLSEDVEPPDSEETKTVKVREKCAIPSHILGRNIENPVIDTFRNGKIPPKPRLGVKIPYKNLTSQIVSKDEIAKEILDRQKQKYKQTGQTTREILFAKTLTQRLAKKIAPPLVGSNSSEVTHITNKNKDEAINNSDLLAILEGDEEEFELNKAESGMTVSTSNVGNSGAVNAKQDISNKTDVNKKTGVTLMSKVTEREIALKQLNELPVGPRRRKIDLSVFSKRRFDDPSVKMTIIGKEINAPLENEKQSKDDTLKSDVPSKLELPKVTVATLTGIIHNKQKSADENSTIATTEEQLEAMINELKESAVSTKSEIDTKTNEDKQVVANKDITSELVENTEEQPIDTFENVSQEQIEVQDLKDVTEESIPQATSSNPVEITAVSKTTEIKVLSNVKVGEKTKKVDISSKIVPTKTAETSKIAVPLKDEFIARKHTGNPPVKTYTRKRKSTEDISTVSSLPDKKPAVGQKEATIPPNTYITKSSRIIKKKVIWDPDEPSTRKSLIIRSPKADNLKSEKIATKPETNIIRVERKPLHKPMVKTEVVLVPKSPDSQKIKKRLSEVDKLLMDEGAVNLLYAFKNVDEAMKKKKAGLISLDRAQKELLNKTNELKKDLRTNSDKVSPKSLRRKDSPVPTSTKKIIPASVSRKKSKDSNRSSLHSPPASPSMIYMNHAEASRIIRRHSSSSYSSMDGDLEMERKAETDGAAASTDSEKIPKKRGVPVTSENVKSKRPKRSLDKDNAVVIENDKAIEGTSKKFNKLAENQQTNALKYEKYKTISVKELDHMVQIILLPSFNNEAYLTPEILNELCSIIKELEADNNCSVVVVSSSASSFCHGINYKTLISDKEQSRKTFARKLATCVTNFLRALASFPKILVAGVHGDTVGLGVTILPLFDMVIASDTATFSIPNARLGCATEGGSLLALPHLMHNVLVSELLYASRKLIAAEALRLGMVTRVLWPDKFQQELVSIVRTISNQSPQFMELTKKQLRQHMMQHVEEALGKEVEILIQHWTSSECQNNFGVYG